MDFSWEGVGIVLVAIGTAVGAIVAARRSASKEVVESLRAALEIVKAENGECQSRCTMLFKRVVSLERRILERWPPK